jgi:hypothetical protein
VDHLQLLGGHCQIINNGFYSHTHLQLK